MTATATMPAVHIRTAASSSVCAAAGCTRLIDPGMKIEHVPGTGWTHIACARSTRLGRAVTGRAEQPGCQLDQGPCQAAVTGQG